MKRRSDWKLLVPAICLCALLPPSLSAQSAAPVKLRLNLPGQTLSARGSEGNDSQESQAQSAATPPGLTLEQLQQIARANNPTLGQAQAGVRAAAGRTRQAGLWPNPTVGYTGEEIRGGSFGGGQHGVFIQQNILLGGKLRLDKQVFAAEGKQAETEADEQRLRVENGVRIAFYQSLAAQRMVEIREKLDDLAKDAVLTTKQLFNVGQADEPDLLQAQVETDEAELAVIASQQEQRRAWRVLAAVVGKPDLGLAHLEGNLENLPQIDPEQITQTILRDSPALKIAQLGVTRADAMVTRAQREVVPDLSLRAGYLNNREQLGTIPPQAVGSEGFAEVGVNLRLFNRNQGNIQAARADQERAKLDVQRVSLVLRQLAAPILESYATSRASVERYKTTTLPNAERAYELYLQRYKEGAAAYPQVLIAQRTLFQLQASYISALESVWTNAVTLQGLLLTDGLDLPATPGELNHPIREINMPVTEVPGAPR
jgi:outer membrane protein, heavy metal efflux system